MSTTPLTLEPNQVGTQGSEHRWNPQLVWVWGMTRTCSRADQCAGRKGLMCSWPMAAPSRCKRRTDTQCKRYDRASSFAEEASSRHSSATMCGATALLLPFFQGNFKHKTCRPRARPLQRWRFKKPTPGPRLTDADWTLSRASPNSLVRIALLLMDDVTRQKYSRRSQLN